MSSTHTKWELGDIQHTPYGFQQQVIDSDGEEIAWAECIGGDDANARLIAAAPDLLAACKAARLALFNGCRFPDPENGFHHCHECEGCQRIKEADHQLTAAIAAAEGGE